MMSNKYYYFAASLPSISFESKMPFLMEDFLSDCERLLTQDDYLLLRYVLSGGCGQKKVINAAAEKWLAFEKAFTNEMVIGRAQELKKDPSDYLHGTRDASPQLTDAVLQAVKCEGPLVAEKILDQVKFTFLEDLEIEFFFSIENIIIYALKLKILDRYRLFDGDDGENLFNEITGLVAVTDETK
ncbi:MAG: DUF2764 family protein [Candidatus Omnitrophica bacterium]|nr:DUF2764 family protein [Candidatus Omnitrophota bacterium]